VINGRTINLFLIQIELLTALIFLVEGKLAFDRFKTNERFVRFKNIDMSQFVKQDNFSFYIDFKKY